MVYWLKQVESDQDILDSNPTFAKIILTEVYAHTEH